MNTGNRSAAGLRRSAVAERNRIREEWSALKGTENEPVTKNTLPQKVQKPQTPPKNKEPVPFDVLRGVVALVEIGNESRAQRLRVALATLGATVVPKFDLIVTHVIWAEGGCKGVRATARALGCQLVSPLWVESCAVSCRRLPAQTFPAAARASDLPSPRTLRTLLLKAEMEFIPLEVLVNNSEDQNTKAGQLRISSETDDDRSTVIDIETRVNTAPRRALPASITPPPRKSRRKLFTQKDVNTDTDSDDNEAATHKRVNSKLTQTEKRGLARAERMAKRLVAKCTPKRAQTQTAPVRKTPPLRIVLTGMSRSERRVVSDAIRTLGGRLQSEVTWKTTHVLLGSCREDGVLNPLHTQPNTQYECDFTGVENINRTATMTIPSCDIKKARTYNALAGAARGCRVLYGQWALDSLKEGKWLHHNSYEVPHLRKMSENAYCERKAMCYMRSDYGYDVFRGIRVRFASNVEQKEAVTKLLKLCGALILNPNGEIVRDNALSRSGLTQNGPPKKGPPETIYDVTIGTEDGTVGSKWVFDSVASGRMRSTRTYYNRCTSYVEMQALMCNSNR